MFAEHSASPTPQRLWKRFGRPWYTGLVPTTEGGSQALSSAIGRLRKAGYKLTNARRTVLQVLAQYSWHLNSTEILAAVQERDPRIGRTTVFRTLQTLSSLSIVRPASLEARSPVYILMPDDGHHAHVVCLRCKKVVEISDCTLHRYMQDVANRHSVLVTGHLLEIFALCQDCATREPREDYDGLASNAT